MSSGNYQNNARVKDVWAEKRPSRRPKPSKVSGHVDAYKAESESSVSSSSFSVESDGGIVEDEKTISENIAPAEVSNSAAITYHLQLLTANHLYRIKSSENPFSDLKIVEDKRLTWTEGSTSPVFEVKYSQAAPKGFPSETQEAFRFKKVKFEDIVIHELGKTHILIRSRLLIDALRLIISYYPSQNLTGEEITIIEPYHALVHHFDELKAIADTANISTLESIQNQNSTTNEVLETTKHVAMLVTYIGTFMQASITPALERIQRDPPAVRWQDAWLIFKPGIDVYFKIYRTSDSVISSAVIFRVREMPNSLAVFVWNLRYEDSYIKRFSDVVHIEKFDGEREVLGLDIYPCKIWDSKDNGKRRRAFEERGSIAFHLNKSGPKQMYYSGQIHETKRKNTYRGLIVVDEIYNDGYNSGEEYEDEGDEDEDDGDGFIRGAPNDTAPSNPDLISGSETRFKFAEYEQISVKKKNSLSEHHYFLTTPFTRGFALSEKTWRFFDRSSVVSVPIKYDNAMDRVIMEPKSQEIIKAISHPQSHFWKLDFIQGKGEGQIVLLHGPPGVGKSYTAECIAESTGRPLITLTIADIGIKEDQIERKLVKWFTLAEHFNAILHIDEADIFLERRRGADIARNGLVSVFLRRMEYFRGLLFLTSNRIGQIDDAFLSRVHVVIEYSPLTDDKRKRIWNSFFQKLEHDMMRQNMPGIANEDEDEEESKLPVKISISKYAKEYVLQDKAVKALKWNGREIRNAFQTAISLAGYRAMQKLEWETDRLIDVQEEDFADVVMMSGRFHHYMNSIGNSSEGERAQMRLERNDDSRKERKQGANF